MSLLQPMMIAALLLTGMGVALLGSLKVPLARRLEIDEARVGGLVSIFGFAMIPVILTAGFLTDLVGRQAVIIGGSVLLAASLLLLAQARSYSVAFVAVILVSAAWSLLINVGNVLVPKAFGGSMAYATNLANVFFGLGAFLTPLAVAFLVSRSSFPATVSFLGVLALVPGALALGVDFSVPAPAMPAATTTPAADPGLATLLGDPILWLCGFALFFYGPLEASMGAWTTTFLGERGLGEATAARLLSGFWLMFMAARLVTAFSLRPGSEAVLILVLAAATVPVLLGVVLSRNREVAIVVVLAAGAIFGPIFPTLMAILLGHFEPVVHGRAVGLLFGIGGIGWTMIPILIGAYAQKTSLQRGFLIAVGAAMALTGVALVLTLTWQPPS